MESPPSPPRNPFAEAPPDAPHGDFAVWVRREGSVSWKEGFGARAYWRFGKNMRPYLFFKIKVNGVIYRFTLKPNRQDSWPAQSVLQREIAMKAAREAADFGRPQLDPELED